MQKKKQTNLHKNPLLSKSLYIPSNGSLFESIKGVPVPEIRNMSKALPKIDKFDVDLNKDLKIKYEITRIENEFEDFIENINYSKAAAPFITNTFHVQRKKAYKDFQKVIENETFIESQFYKLQFLEKVDKQFLQDFKARMKAPYVDLVFQKHYNIPKEVDFNKVKEVDAYQELYKLSIVVAIWTVEVEMAADAIERCQLYGLYDQDNEKRDLIDKLKQNGKGGNNKFSVNGFTKKLLKSVLMKLIKKMSSFFSSKGLNYTSISWSACLGLLTYVIGGAAMPWAALASQINIPWICGGFLASKVLDKIGNSITKNEVLGDISAISNAIQQNAEELMIYQKSLSDLIEKCYKSESEKEFEFFKKQVGKKLDNLLESQQNGGNLNASVNLNKSRLNLSRIQVKEEDDWVICELDEDDHEIEKKKGQQDDEDDEEHIEDDIPIIQEVDGEGEEEQ